MIQDLKIRVLMEDGCTQEEAESYLNDGTIVAPYDEFVEIINVEIEENNLTYDLSHYLETSYKIIYEDIIYYILYIEKKTKTQ